MLTAGLLSDFLLGISLIICITIFALAREKAWFSHVNYWTTTTVPYPINSEIVCPDA